MSITYKDAEGIQGMREACRLASEVLDYLTPHVKAGDRRNTPGESARLADEFAQWLADPGRIAVQPLA